VTVCNGNHVRAFVGKWEDKCLVSFEGTSDITSAIKDLEFLHSAVPWNGCEGCKVHGGFLDEYNSVRGCVKAVLAGTGCPVGSEIRTTGHSLGAAMNSLAMMDLTDAGWIIEESYDFGKPRVGDTNFAAAHNKLLGDRVFRVTHSKDPVPQVPPDSLIVDWHFEHVEPEVWYQGKVADGFQQCTVAHDKTQCAEQFWNIPLDLLHIEDHLDYMEAATSIFGCSNSEELSV
jgi:predicted lipase